MKIINYYKKYIYLYTYVYNIYIYIYVYNVKWNKWYKESKSKSACIVRALGCFLDWVVKEYLSDEVTFEDE